MNTLTAFRTGHEIPCRLFMDGGAGALSISLFNGVLLLDGLKEITQGQYDVIKGFSPQSPASLEDGEPESSLEGSIWAASDLAELAEVFDRQCDPGTLRLNTRVLAGPEVNLGPGSSLVEWLDDSGVACVQLRWPHLLTAGHNIAYGLIAGITEDQFVQLHCPSPLHQSLTPSDDGQRWRIPKERRDRVNLLINAEYFDRDDSEPFTMGPQASRVAFLMKRADVADLMA